MQKKRIRTIIILVFVLIISSIFVIFSFASPTISETFSLGKLLADVSESDDDTIVAVYHGQTVTAKEVAYARRMQAFSASTSSSASASDYEIARQLIRGMMLLDEAERLGLTATEDEVEAMVVDIVANYNDIPESKRIVDEYCEGAGLTIDEYFAQIELEAPNTLTRQKLKNSFAEEFYQSNPNSSFEDMNAAYEQYCNEVYEAYSGNVEYFVSPS